MHTMKYRAYIKPLKRYAEKYETILYHHQCNMEPSWTVNISPEEYYGDEELAIEQFTGLLDRNGKEMYEGDIVALLFGYVPMKSVTAENIRIENAQKAVIHFDTARAAFRYTIKLQTPKDCQFKPGTNTNMVVIGNVHENPELLGGGE